MGLVETISSVARMTASFGFYKGYHFNDYEWVKEYMKELEYGEINISVRGMVPVRVLRVKSGE